MIRPMLLKDLESVMTLETLCFSVPWSKEAFHKEITENKLAHYLVIEEADEIIAYGGVWYIYDEGHITNIAVHPNHRKKGFGKDLVQAMMDQAKTDEIHHMTLEVRVSNQPAITLYEKIGFESAGIRPKYYTDNQEDALIMWRTL